MNSGTCWYLAASVCSCQAIVCTDGPANLHIISWMQYIHCTKCLLEFACYITITSLANCDSHFQYVTVFHH